MTASFVQRKFDESEWPWMVMRQVNNDFDNLTRRRDALRSKEMIAAWIFFVRRGIILSSCSSCATIYKCIGTKKMSEGYCSLLCAAIPALKTARLQASAKLVMMPNDCKQGR